MRHEHLVVTVEAGLKERIDDDLDAGESLESWVADAIEHKLERSETERRDPGRLGGEKSAADSDETPSERDGRFGTRSDDRRSGTANDSGDESRDSRGGDGAFERTRDDGFESDGGEDEYDEGFEYVDDCSI